MFNKIVPLQQKKSGELPKKLLTSKVLSTSLSKCHFFPALEHCMLNGILKVSFSMPNFHVLQSFCQPTIIFFHVSEREKAAKRNRRRRKSSSVLYVVCPALRQFVVNRERLPPKKKTHSSGNLYFLTKASHKSSKNPSIFELHSSRHHILAGIDIIVL